MSVLSREPAFAESPTQAAESLQVREASRASHARPRPHFRSVADSLDWQRARALADGAQEFRVVVSLFERQIWVIDGTDTLLNAPAAVASGLTLDYQERSWTFRTPRGRRRVIRRVINPVWTPPDWHYAEVALDHGLKLAHLPSGSEVRLRSGARLTVRSRLVLIIPAGSTRFQALPVDEHIVFDSKLFIPPRGTLNRRISGELGRYAIDLGDGYLIHGTPHASSIGRAITHGCIRLADDDIEWLYENVREGTPVYVF